MRKCSKHLEDREHPGDRRGHGYIVHLAHAGGDLVETEQLLPLGSERELGR